MAEETQERPIAASYHGADGYKSSVKAPVEKSPEPAADPKPQKEASDPVPEKVEDKKVEATDTPAKDPSAPPAKEGKIAEATDTSGKDSQEEKDRKETQRRDRSAEGRVKELLADKAREKERADKLEKELEDMRKASAAPKPAEVIPEPKPEVKPAAAAPPSADKDPRPSLKAITQKAADGIEPYAGKEYEELQDIWSGEVDDWREREATRKDLARKAAAESEEATKRATTETARAEARNRNYQSSMQSAKTKYSDFDQVVEANIRTNTMSNEGIKAGLGAAMNPGELVYELSKDGGAEYVRIAKLPPDEAFTETVWLDRHLAKQAAKPAAEPVKPEPVAATPKPDPEPPPAPKPAVSKVPAPYVPANGVEDPTPKKATSYHGPGGFKRGYQPDGRPRA